MTKPIQKLLTNINSDCCNASLYECIELGGNYWECSKCGKRSDSFPVTPPTHPETEKLIDEVVSIRPAKGTCCPEMDVTVCRGCGHDHGRQYLIDRDTTSFASGRAQGAREDRKNIKKMLNKKLIRSTEHGVKMGWYISEDDFQSVFDALKGET